MERLAIIGSFEQLSDVVSEAVRNTIEKIEREKKLPERLYSKNEVSKLLKRSYNTISKLCANGTIKTTADGWISDTALNEYLSK